MGRTRSGSTVTYLVARLCGGCACQTARRRVIGIPHRRFRQQQQFTRATAAGGRGEDLRSATLFLRAPIALPSVTDCGMLARSCS